MENVELDNIAQVVYNKIHNANIIYYEEIALMGEDYTEKVLPIDISIYDIKQAILEQKNLNHLNNLPMENYLNLDLNAFFSRVCMIRKTKIFEYIKVIENTNREEIGLWLPAIMECFTIEEQRQLKIAFVKKMTNYINVESMLDSEMDAIFLYLLNNLIEQSKGRLERNRRL